MKITNFVFDLYGTLIDIKTDESPLAFWQGVAEYVGGSSHEVREEYLSLCAAQKRGENHEIDLLSVFKQMLAIRGRNADEAPAFAAKFRELSMKKLRCFPYAKRILQGLRSRGCGVYLVSNAQACFTVSELESCGLSELFDGIILSSDVGAKKPGEEIFRYAFEKFGISPEDSIYVGNDLRDDILGASSVGMRTAYIRTEQSGSYTDPLPKPTFLATTHKELMQTLFSLAK